MKVILKKRDRIRGTADGRKVRKEGRQAEIDKKRSLGRERQADRYIKEEKMSIN